MKGTDLAMSPKEQPALYFVGNVAHVREMFVPPLGSAKI
jgi:hypothetical protein